MERNPAGEKKGTRPTCVHKILRDEGNTGPGLRSGSLRKFSVGVLLPVCRTYKSSQKVGGSLSVRLGLGEREKLSEGFSDPQTDIQANAGFSQKRRQGFTEGEKDTESQSPRQTDTETEKGRSTSKLRAMARTALPECGRGTEASGRERRAGGALPGSPACTPASGVQRRGKGDGGQVPVSWERGEQSKSLTSPRPEVESSKFAARDYSSASPFGPEAARATAGPVPAALVRAS